MDTGAGVSLIDYNSLKHIGLHNNIKSRKSGDNGIINASGNEMDIVGIVDIPVVMGNTKTVIQEFKVLNTESYSIILMGRDFMSKFKTVKFDFVRRKVQLGKTWISCLHVDVQEKVRLLKRTVIPARSETMISVRCKNNLSMQTVDFDPVPVKGVPGVFVSKARVVPDVCGEFQLAVVNVNECDVNLHGRTILGFVQQIGKTVAAVNVDQKSSVVDSIQYGDKLSSSELLEAQKLVKKYQKLFTENSKKPKQTHLVNHQIITEDALPVKSKKSENSCCMGKRSRRSDPRNVKKWNYPSLVIALEFSNYFSQEKRQLHEICVRFSRLE